MGTVPDNMTLCYGAIMNDFDLKHKIMNPRGNCHKVMHRPPFFKAFLMYQFEGQADYLVDTVNKYFHMPFYHVFDAREESGLGIKSCKICRLLLASDFGIASLTPLNNNVFFEVGLMQGLGKPVVYLVGKDFEYDGKKGALAVPFDLSDQMVIEYGTAEELAEKLEKEIPAFVEKVQLSTVYEKESIEFIKKKIHALEEPKCKNLLKFLILEPTNEIDVLWKSMEKTGYSSITYNELIAALDELTDIGFVKRKANLQFTLEERYRDILKQLLFRDEG